MPSVLNRNERPMAACQRPARSDAICSGSRRLAASISPHVSSAVAYDGEPACRSDDTTMPSRVQASTSMCGYDAALADQPELRQPLQQRGADRGPLADEHQRLRGGQPLGQLVHVGDVVGETVTS